MTFLVYGGANVLSRFSLAAVSVTTHVCFEPFGPHKESRGSLARPDTMTSTGPGDFCVTSRALGIFI